MNKAVSSELVTDICQGKIWPNIRECKTKAVA